MDSFLKLVAEDLYERTNGNLANVAVVFPNKRAGLFFNDYLASCSDTPIWSPSYISIKELFQNLSNLELGDPVKLVCEIYKVYVDVTKSTENLDDFYAWGEMMINDFDDVDKNLVDSEKLFSNLQQLRDMDDYSFLDEEQEQAIREFFNNFSIERRTQLKNKFISMWEAIRYIYPQFKETLAKKGIAYEGMLYRDAMENIDNEELSYSTYVFVGFNVLNKVEHKLFKKLQDAGKALFYWDYDKFYMSGYNEAGTYIKKNMEEFPSPLPGELFDKLSQPKEIRYISAPTENAQVRYLPSWIRENITESEKETAVVLCNEALLQPVLHSLPENVKHINITMGFPLSQTPIFSFLTSFADVHLKGYNSETGRFSFQAVIKLLKHPYTRQLSQEASILEQSLTKSNRFYPLPSELKKDDLLSLLFTPCTSNLEICMVMNLVIEKIATLYKNKEEDTDPLLQLYKESIFQAYTTIARFRTLIEDKDLDVKPETFNKLLMKVLSSTNIPFHGEPAIGMQVMGVLETRNLDFRHLVLMSVNEGQLPKTGGNASFIPYNLRKAFGLTTVEHNMALYAFYFYRLIQRAEKVTLLYNTSSDGLNRGEISRFMLQLLIDYPNKIIRQSLETSQSPLGVNSIRIKKDIDIMRRLQQKYDLRANKKAKFSPSALNTYLDCSLKFYFKYIVDLSVPDEVNAEIDSATFGSIFHKVAENIYKDLTSHKKTINKEEIETLLKNDFIIRNYIDEAFKELFFHVSKEEKPEYNGTQLINSEVINRYVRQLLRQDAQLTPFTYVASEKEVYEDIDINTPKGVIKSRIGGIIDRLDSKDGVLRIVDYKTGGDASIPANIESLFIRDKRRSNYIFQTFIYASIMCRKESIPIAPALLYIHKSSAEDYSPIIQIGEPYKQK